MATRFVRLTGDDTTGDGSLGNPYLTIYKATTVVVDNDVIDVGEGTFDELIPSDIGQTIHIKGVSPLKTKWRMPAVPAVSPTRMVRFTSLLNNKPGKVLISKLTIEPGVVGIESIFKVEGVPNGSILVARSVLRYLGNTYGAIRTDVTDKYFAFVNTTQVSAVFGQLNGRAVLDRCPDEIREQRTILINNIFKGLKVVVDDEGTSRSTVSDWNCYFGNERNLRIGQFGSRDIFDDPQFVAEVDGTYGLGASSKCINAGLKIGDLGIQASERLVLNALAPFGDGMIRDRINPPTELNWDGYGELLDIGAEEYPLPDTNRQLNTTTIQNILAAFGSEIGIIKANFDYAENGRFLSRADTKQLQAKWGVLTGLFRFASFTRNDYEDLIREVYASESLAPSFGSMSRTIAELLGLTIKRYEYYNNARWRIGDSLKLTVPDPIGFPNTVRVTAGRVQALRQWFEVTQQDTVLADGLHLLGVTPNDPTTFLPNFRPALQVFPAISDEGIPLNTIFLAGVPMRVTRGSPIVTNPTTLVDFTDFEPGLKLKFRGERQFFIKSIESDKQLTMTEEYPDDDQVFASAQFGVPLVPFGFVAVADGEVKRLVTHSRIGSTAFQDSIRSRFNTYVLEPESDEFNASVFGGRPEIQMLLDLLFRLKPVHKLAYMTTFGDAGKGVPLGVNPADAPSLVEPWVELFDDTTWDNVLF